MFEKLSLIGINLNSAQEQKFVSFIELFKDYNTKVNLVSSNDAGVLFEKHIFDSLAFNLFYEKYLSGTSSLKLLDIGTGGGFPSIALSIFYENFNITPIDSVNKKINFIKYAAEELKLYNIAPLCSRVEDLPPSYKSGYDAVVSRAMADLRMILEYAIPFVKTGGYFAAYKSLKAEEEIKNARNALKILNSEIVDIIDYKLPLNEENTRKLIVVKKNKETSSIYPRKNGLIKKNPL